MNALNEVIQDAAKDQKNVAGVNMRLLSFIERIERLEEEKKAIADDIKEIKSEAKSDGFDLKIITLVLKIRKMDEGDRAEQEASLETYLSNLGM